MTAPTTASDFRTLVDQAARPVPLLWPLMTMVAASPLWDLRHLPFPEAVEQASRSMPVRGYPSAALLAQAVSTGRITSGDLAEALNRSAPPPAGLTGPRAGSAHIIRENVTLAEGQDRRHGRNLAGQADREVSRWCTAYLSRLMPSSASGAEPADPGFYLAWRSVVGADPVGRRIGIGPLVERLSPAPDEAAAACLDLLGLTRGERSREVTGQLTRQPGWAAYAKWRSQWAAADHPAPPLYLVDYLAVRLAYDVAFRTAPDRARRPAGRSPDLPRPEPTAAVLDLPVADIPDEAVRGRLTRLPPRQAAGVWLAAYENNYRDRLLSALSAARPGPADRQFAVQVICCIDARSEGLRRHLEGLGDYETFGFAGFFGVPARVRPYGGGEPANLFPVLVQPAMEVDQEPADASRGASALAAAADLAATGTAVTAARKSPAAAYLIAEAGGLALGPLSALRTVSPRGFAALRRLVTGIAAPEAAVSSRLCGPGAPGDGEQARYAEAALRAMDLTQRFASIVVLCGHGSSTENNPYASALDCGACGASRGGTSARLAAAMLNRAPVRSVLAGRGIVIGDDTVFLAAEHDTATDAVTIYPPEQRTLTARQQRLMADLDADLARAGAALAAERASVLPGAGRAGRGGRPSRWRRSRSRSRSRASQDNTSQDRATQDRATQDRASRNRASRHVATRSADWAQVQPEWGLAGNAAFIIGPRRMTENVDLARRVFLHSYESGTDPDGAVLESILAGPMVVAHWISACYYFSTVDPDVLGAGDKIAHNIVGGLAVCQGPGGDLRVGLPRQAVFDRERVYHEPMRLLVLIDAPPARIDQVISRSRDLTDLVNGEWIRLTARDAGRFWVREGSDWQPWRPR